MSSPERIARFIWTLPSQWLEAPAAASGTRWRGLVYLDAPFAMAWLQAPGSRKRDSLEGLCRSDLKVWELKTAAFEEDLLGQSRRLTPLNGGLIGWVIYDHLPVVYPQSLHFFAGSLDHKATQEAVASNFDEDGRNPFRTTWKPWESIVRWYLQGNPHSVS